MTYISLKYKGYHDNKTATVSVWRAASEEHDGRFVVICKQDEDAVAFRDRAGRPCEGVLQLALRGFHPTVRKKVLPASTQDCEDKTSILFETLTKLLNEAESV